MTADPALHASAFAASPVALLVLGRNGSIGAANPAAAALFGCADAADLLGISVLSLVADGQRSELASMVRAACAGSRSSRRELPFVRPDGAAATYGFLVAAIPATADAAPRAAVMISDVTSERRRLEARLARVAVRPLLERALDGVGNAIHLVRNYREVPLVLADEPELAQVFVHLLTNAAQAIPEGRADLNEISVETSTIGGRVCIEVRDTGIGISAADQLRVFDPFFARSATGGVGLGLSISQQVVTALGGSIEVESTPGVGSVFRVFLPAAPGVTPPPAPSTRRRGRILLVDDEPTIANSVKRLLNAEHDVVIASSGREALRLLTEGARFDGILCDLMMPDGNGMEVYRELTGFAPEQARRMVFGTGGAFSQASRQFLDQIPNEYLEKPFDLDQLRATMRRLVALQD